MRKLLLGAITILILACSENKENEGMQSASSAIKTRSGTWILEQVKDTYVFGEQLQLQCSGEGYSGKIHSAVLEMKTDTNEKYLAHRDLALILILIMFMLLNWVSVILK